MARRAKKKLKSKLSLTIEEVLSKAEVDSENIVRLKLTTRKGIRIESLPLKKLEKVANKPKLYWKLEDGWLILYGIS